MYLILFSTVDCCDRIRYHNTIYEGSSFTAEDYKALMDRLATRYISSSIVLHSFQKLDGPVANDRSNGIGGAMETVNG